MRHRTELAAIWPPTAEAACEAGHAPQSPLSAIRAKCRDCCCYQPGEVRRCEAVKCPLWPFRAGLHPWHAALGKTRQSDGVFERGEAIHDGARL
jgi:hypothetical protein